MISPNKTCRSTLAGLEECQSAEYCHKRASFREAQNCRLFVPEPKSSSTPAQTLTFSLKKMRKNSLRPDEEEISINMTGRARKMRKRVIQSDEDDDINNTPSPSKHALVPIDSRQSGKSDLCHVSVSPKPGHWGRLEGIGYY